MRRTKIVATFGPASAEIDTIEALFKAGVNVARLNFSHGTHASHATMIQNLRCASQRSGCQVALLQDTAWTQRLAASGSAADMQSAVAYAACRLAEDIDADAILVCTISGSTARNIVKFRPRPLVVAMSPDAQTRQFLRLLWGTEALELPASTSTDDMEQQALRLACERGLLQPGQRVVLTAGIPLAKPGLTNMIKIVSV